MAPSFSSLRMIILGAPGSGKGTLISRCQAAFPIRTVGVGDLLRAQIVQKTALGAQAEGFMKRGALLPDEVILQLVEKELSVLEGKHWVLDGYPRNGSQARSLDSLLQSRGVGLNLILNLVVPDSVILDRIENRWIHAPSGRVYNHTFNPPKVQGRDDVTGESLTKRPDDDVNIFGKRLKDFHKENKTLLEHYAGSKVGGLERVLTFTGNTTDEIWPHVKETVKGRMEELKVSHS
ncbi:ADK-domain-containing protein [Atractiella rhizophila]|nr:ADK-domain-containing protein [Atractiella rhizophila]